MPGTTTTLRSTPAALRTNAYLSQRIEVSPGLAILRVVPDGWQVPDFTAGQFAVLGLPGDAPRFEGAAPEENAPAPDKLLKRAYSIASASTQKEYLEFFVALVPTGGLTPRLFALEAGDRLWLGPKATGRFTLDAAPADADLVLVSTGTGLAPYMSMLRSHLDAGEDRHVALLHGARHSWDLGYRSELMTLARMCERFHYLPVISRPRDEEAGWAGPTGYVQDLWNEGHVAAAFGRAPSAANTHVFLCGNPAMIDGMVGVLEYEGFVEPTKDAPGQIHVERYW